LRKSEALEVAAMHRLFGIVLLLGLSLTLPSIALSTAEPQRASTGLDAQCDVTHEGDLVIERDEVFVIQEVTYCQRGNIIVKDDATLKLIDSEIVFEQTDEWVYIRVQDRGSFQAQRANLISENLDEISFDGTSNILIEGSELDWFHCHDSSTVTIRGSTIRHFHPHTSCTVDVSDSLIKDHIGILLDISNAQHTISNIRPGFFQEWDFRRENPEANVGYNITLTNTKVENFYVHNNAGPVTAYIKDSSLGGIGCEFGLEYFIIRTTASGLNIDDFIGDITFDQATLRGWMNVNRSVVTISGSLNASNASANFSSSTVIRNYDVLVVDLAEGALPNVMLDLYDPSGIKVWSGVSDSEGRVTFKIVFNDDNYQDEWTLKATLPHGEVITRSVGFLTDTPIEIVLTRRASKLPDTLVVGTMRNPLSLDPHPRRLIDEIEIIPNIYETLIAFEGESTNRFVPILSTEVPSIENGLISVNDDNSMTFTFPIRQGVRFHNGDLLSPEDIAYSLLRWALHDILVGWGFVMALTGTSDLDRLIAEVGEVAACQRLQNAIQVQGDRVIIHLQLPYSTLLAELTNAWIVDRSWVAAHGGWSGDCQTWIHYRYPSPQSYPMSDRANGTGPFVLERWRPGQEIVLVRNESYWREPARLSRVILRQVGSWDELMWMVIDNETDMIGYYYQWPYSGWPYSGPFPEIPDVGDAKVYNSLPVTTFRGFFFTQSVNIEGGNSNIGSGQLGEEGIPPDFFSDVDVRKGFLYAFDYERYIREAYQDLAEQPRGPIPRGLFGYNPDWPTYHYDPEKAIEHFKRAWGGEVWEKGFKTTVSYNQGNPARKLAAGLLKENIEALNPRFHIEIKAAPWSTYLNSFLAAREPIFLLGFLNRDPNAFVYGYMHSRWLFAQAQGFGNPEYDGLIEEALRTFDEDRLQEIYDELQRLAYEDAIHGLYVQPHAVHIEQPWVRGWYYNPALPTINFYEIWKEIPAQ